MLEGTGFAAKETSLPMVVPTSRAEPAPRRRPWLLRWKRSVSESLSSEGLSYLLLIGAVFIGAMLRQVNLLLLLGGMLVGPLVLNWRLVAATLRGLEVRRRLPRSISAGDQLVATVELTNTRRRIGSWAVVLEEEVHAEGDPAWQPEAAPTVLFSYVPARQSRSVVYRGRLPRRGWYQFGPARVSTQFPFGLVRRSRMLDVTDRVLVYPRTGWLTPRWQARQHESFEGTHRVERRQSNASGDLYGVREWRHGDSRRWIHWRSSAKLGNLVVRQFEQNRNRDLALLVDLWQPAEPSVEDHENIELAVSFAATVVADMCRKGDSRLLLGITGVAPDLIGGSASASFMQEAMERLAVAVASDREQLFRLLEQTLAQVEPGTEIVVVGPRPFDIGNTAQYPNLWRLPHWRAMLRRLRVISTADDSLAEYFQIDKVAQHDAPAAGAPASARPQGVGA